MRQHACRTIDVVYSRLAPGREDPRLAVRARGASTCSREGRCVSFPCGRPHGRLAPLLGPELACHLHSSVGRRRMWHLPGMAGGRGMSSSGCPHAHAAVDRARGHPMRHAAMLGWSSRVSLTARMGPWGTVDPNRVHVLHNDPRAACDGARCDRCLYTVLSSSRVCSVCSHSRIHTGVGR